jgi:hypothetical protein
VAFVALLRRQSRPQLRPPARETLPKLQRCHWAKHAAVRPRFPHLSTPAWPLRAQVWRNGATPAGARRTPPRPGALDPPERSWFSGDPHICRPDYSSFAIGVRPKRQDFSWFSPKGKPHLAALARPRNCENALAFRHGALGARSAWARSARRRMANAGTRTVIAVQHRACAYHR